MESQLSPSFSSPQSDSQIFTDLKSKEGEMINVARKIIENINLMSFVNMDDRQVHSLMKIREIALGIAYRLVEKVTKNDVDIAMSCGIMKMVSLCNDTDNILTRLNSGGMENGLSEPVSRMKEIVSTVTKRAKLTPYRNRNSTESVDWADAMSVASKVCMATSNNNIDVVGFEKILFLKDEAETYDETGNQGNTIDGSMCLGVVDVQVRKEKDALVIKGEVGYRNGAQFTQAEENQLNTIDESVCSGVEDDRVEEGQRVLAVETCNGAQNTQAEENQWNILAESMCLEAEDVQHVSAVDGEAEACNDVQYAQAEKNVWNTIDESLCFGVEDVQVEEEHVSAVNGEAEVCNGVQVTLADEKLIENAEEKEEAEGVFSVNNDENSLISEVVTNYIPLSITWPGDGKVTLDWVKNVMTTLEQASKTLPPSDFQSVMPITVVDELIDAASSILTKEPNCVEVDCHKEDSRVVVVGDIHGQFHDLLHLFELAGLPSENQFYVFNGDYVDRGAWGLEVLLILLAWKVLMPGRVYLLRGNHETKYCTSVYGFEEEIKTKFGDQYDLVYKKCLECFKELPLASVISRCVFTAHGGLFRSMNAGPLRRSKRKRAHKLELGSLEDLSKVNRHLIDVADEDPSVLTDVLWSDPSKKKSLLENGDRGLGLSWGPDCTEKFLKQSKLKLIIRSHQGPDARVDQDDFGDMLCGYSTDHVGESGKLYTLFSAPCYPQFGETKFKNEGAYAVLVPPNFENPSFHSFKAVERPQPITSNPSVSRAKSPVLTSSMVDFEALGIPNLPSWSVSLADKAGGTKVVQVPRAPSVEGLPFPMPTNLEETQRAAFEYLFELVAGLKHMLSTRI